MHRLAATQTMSGKSTMSQHGFTDVVHAFEGRNPSVRSLELLIQDCHALRHRDADNAAVYALVEFTTTHLVDLFGGSATTLDEASDVDQKLLSCCKELAASLDGDPSRKIAAMNALVVNLIE